VNYVLSNHAREQMAERGITEAEVDAVLQNPQQIVDADRGRKAYQSLVVRGGRMQLLRAIVAVAATPPVVVSVYATTQGRYWRQP
jgi:hypothetical protein